MGIAKAEDLNLRLKHGFVREHHDRIYRLLCWAFGEKERVGAASLGDGDFPNYPDVTPKMIEVGQSRRILNSQFIRLTSSMYGQPEPDFPDTDRYSGEVLKQFYLRRSLGQTGTGIEEEWLPERSLAFLEGDGVGVGFVQLGLRTTKATGKQRVVARHAPATNVIWDPYVSSPTDARWICVVHNMDPDQALALYGAKALKDGIRPVMDDSGVNTGREVFRVFEYYDRGIGKNDPTMALFAGSMKSDPFARVANPFGDFLPFAHYEHFVPPGCTRPIGRIMLQLSTQASINKIEQKIDRTIESGDAADLLDLSALDASDVKEVKDGRTPRFIKFAKFWDGKPPFVRLPAKEIPQSVMERWNILDRQMEDDSGTTDSDHGQLSQQRRTLGENQIVEAKAATKASWSRMQAAKMEQRLVGKALYVARLFDKDPVMLSIFGAQVLINDPTKPESCIGNFAQNVGAVLIDEASLEYQDAQSKQGQRLANLSQLLPRVQGNSPTGTIDPRWYDEQLLKAIGEKDPDSALVAPQPMMPPGMPGMPGMPPGAPGMPPPGPGPVMPTGVPPSPAMAMPMHP